MLRTTAPDDHSADDVPDAVEGSDTDTAQRFVVVARYGGFGGHYRAAAQTAVDVAIQHGFDEDPLRVAEAVIVLLHPSHR